MAEFILKDWYGKDCRFNHDTIFVQDVNGELVQFTQGKGESVLESLEVTENGTYTPNEGVDGFDSVTVDVPIPEVVLQDKTITENGTYTADEGFDGLGSVIVDVKGSGGGSLPAGVYLSKSPIDPPNTNRQKRFWYNGELYVATGSVKGDGYATNIYKWNGSSWVTILTATGNYGVGNAYIDVDDFKIVEYNGKLHFFSGKRHAIFDGTTLASSTALTYEAYPFVYQNKLMVSEIGTKTNILYEWNESSSTWVVVKELSKYSSHQPFVINDELYLLNTQTIYKYENGNTSEIIKLSKYPNNRIVINGCYYYMNKKTHYITLYKIDFETNTEKEVGKIPSFEQMFLTQGANELSFTGVTVSSSNSNYAYNYPFFVATIIEE